SLDESCEQGVSRRLSVFSLERYPRLLEQLLLAPPGEIPLEVGLRSFDQDLDGYEDIAVDLSIERPGNDEPARLSMVWLDRPSGLAKDAQEPFATFAAMFERVKGALAKDPSSALDTLNELTLLYDVICKEGGNPKLTLGSGKISCGRGGLGYRAKL